MSRHSWMIALCWLTGISVAAEPAPPPPPPPPCQQTEFRQFDFWQGDWQVHTPGGQLAGTNSIAPIANGCALVEHWQGSQGGTGQSYNFYNATTQQWRQLWISPGVIIDYAGGLQGKSMTLDGHISYQASGQKVKFRGQWTPNDDGSVLQQLSQWNAETGKWDDWFTGVYTRTAKQDNQK